MPMMMMSFCPGNSKSGSLFFPLHTVLQAATRQLKDAGIESPRLEAEILLAHCLKIERIKLYTRWNEELPESQVRACQSLIFRRLRQEPVAYIIGYREFWSLDFLVTPEVLIPRPETEFVVESALDHISGRARVIDVGTGCGVIAVCLARERPEVHVYAVDISESALHVARANAIRHKVVDRITFIRTDLLSPFGPCAVDGIVSNPPYIPTPEISNLPIGVRDYEPRTALDGGTDGLKCSRSLMKEAKYILKRHGWLIFEMGFGQKESLTAEIQGEGYQVQEVVPDYAGLDRVMVARKIS
ncbi:MAG: peptide chain release factor N(5)-glutamine methyltransferase [bacterium]